MYLSNHLASKLRAASVGHEADVVLHDQTRGVDLTYGAFFENAERMAAALVSVGVKPGDRVAVQVPKVVAMLELYVGCVLAGAVFLPLNTAYTASEIGYFLSDASPSVFVCDPDRVEEFGPLAKKCGVSILWTLGSNERGSLIRVRDAQSPGFKAAERGPEDLAVILYTSGTTGRSKGAMLSHRALASNSEVLRDYWQFTHNDVLIHALPIYHTHGLFVATNIVLLSGASMVFLARFDAKTVCDCMKTATALMGVPTFYVRLLQQKSLAESVQNMRLFVSGSAPLLAETHDKWRAVTGHAILERYGMTETNMNTSNPYHGDRRAGTVGFPLPGVSLRVCDPDTGAPLKTGEIGGLEVSGLNLFSGYWNMPEKTAQEFRTDGFFITGDLGKVDADGYVHIVGRAKDLIISGGLNIYPKEIELVIDDLPGVLESAVIAIPDSDFGEAVMAVVVPRAGYVLTPEGVNEGVKGKLARFKQPKQVVIVDELPRNSMGKVQKNLMRENYKRLAS